MVLCCVWSLLWLEEQKLLCSGTVLSVEFIVITATVDIVQLFCVVCEVYCGYSNSSFSAIVLCCVWCLLLLQQQ